MTTITIGGASYDVYSSVAEALVYFQASMDSVEWAAVSNANKEIALVAATRMIDRQVWMGARTAVISTQKLEWPRTDITDKAGLARSSSTVPVEIVTASQELAMRIHRDKSVQESTGGGDEVKSLRADTVDVEFFGSGGRASIWPQLVTELVEQFMLKNLTSTATGTDGTSSFDDDADNSELNEGFQ